MKEESQQAFWIVWCPTNDKTPTYRHETRHMAEQEAERLATSNPGREFFVMKADCMRVVDSMNRVEFDDGIPF